MEDVDISEEVYIFVRYLVENDLLRIITEEDIQDFGKKVYFTDGKGKQLVLKINPRR